MIRKLLKIVFWLISGSSLLIGLLMLGFYLYHGIPMQKNFPGLETKISTNCITSDRWQTVTPAADIPLRVREIFGRFNSQMMDNMLARILIEDMPHHGQLEFGIQLVIGSLEIKRHYSEQQRLGLLMNHVYLGNQGSCSIHGVTAAADHYFGKTLSRLSLAESVLLAGLPKGPSYYSPFRYPDKALLRRNRMLEVLRDEGLVTDEEYQTAVDEPLPPGASYIERP